MHLSEIQATIVWSWLVLYDVGSSKIFVLAIRSCREFKDLTLSPAPEIEQGVGKLRFIEIVD